MTESKMAVACRGATAYIRLTNPDRHNAFDDGLIADLTTAFRDLAARDDVRIVVLESEGRSFCAGADLNWMKRVAGYSHAENIADARGLAEMLRMINFCPKPVIAKVQGAAFGGGVGLISCCDIAIGSTRTSFCLSEVKLGIIPSAISPYVVAAIGQRAARRYFVTAERFDAATALRLGLLHDVVDAEALDAAVDDVIAAIQAAGPIAARAAKDLAFAVDRPITPAVIEDTVQRIAHLRTTPEAKEGMAAFLEKREPHWMVDG